LSSILSDFTLPEQLTIGYAIGRAAGAALEPVLIDLINAANQAAVAAGESRPLELVEAANVAAEDVDAYVRMETEASLTGYDSDRFKDAYGEALNAPGLGPLFELWRRGLIGDGEFTHGLRKAKLEGRWDGPLEGLKETLLSSEELAMLQQQGFVGEGRANSEGALQGVTSERQQLRFEASGLPPGVETGLAMLRRGIIDAGTFAQIVREGHTKTKYTDELLQLRTQVLSASEYATLHLKGHISVAEMNAGGALTGYTSEQMNLLYLGMGRPAAPGQMWTAATRGIDGPAGRPVDQAQFQTAIAQSDIRPEYGPMLWEIRYLYPSLFQLTRLVSSGAIDADVGKEWAAKARYAPEVVDALHASWTGGTTSSTDPHVTKAQTQLWGTLHRSYVADESTVQTAQDTLAALGLSTDTVTGVLDLWNRERALIRKQLTPAQIKKAVAEAVTNPTTGQPWTQDDALARLHDLGYSIEDAQTYMSES
jgi:hypothetical protein